MKIFIDPGHNYNGADTGAQGNGLKEQDITYQIGLKVGDRLKNRGLSVKYSRNSITDNVGSTLAQSINERCSMANSWGANYFVSIHCNAADDKSANGTETLIYAKGGKAEVLAKNVNVRLVSTGLTNRGVKVRTDLGVLKNTNMPAILVEVGFITNARDADMLKNRQDDIADAIANGIFEFLGIETETEEQEMIYNYIDENMPEWAHEAVQWAVDNKIVLGTGDGLGLDYKDLKNLVWLYRAHKLK